MNDQDIALSLIIAISFSLGLLIGRITASIEAHLRNANRTLDKIGKDRKP